MSSELLTMVSAMIAAIAAIISSIVAYRSSRHVAILNNRFSIEKETNQFREKQLSSLYFPMHVNLMATNALFDRYFEKSVTDEEKSIIEHAWKRHNDEIFKILTENSVYLEVDAPREVTSDLLEHIIQWNSVYEMKYIDKTYNGPVFSGISKFGFRGFPKGKKVYFNESKKTEGIDGYFSDKTKSLRESLYSRLSSVV